MVADLSVTKEIVTDSAAIESMANPVVIKLAADLVAIVLAVDMEEIDMVAIELTAVVIKVANSVKAEENTINQKKENLV